MVSRTDASLIQEYSIQIYLTVKLYFQQLVAAPIRLSPYPRTEAATFTIPDEWFYNFKIVYMVASAEKNFRVSSESLTLSHVKRRRHIRLPYDVVSGTYMPRGPFTTTPKVRCEEPLSIGSIGPRPEALPLTYLFVFFIPMLVWGLADVGH